MQLSKAVFLFFVFLLSCQPNQDEAQKYAILTGNVANGISDLTVDGKVLNVENGKLSDTIPVEKGEYKHLLFNKKSKIIYLKPGATFNLNIKENWIDIGDDRFNTFLLNRDSLLVPYTAKWDMNESAYIKIWETEMPTNISRIDKYFENTHIPKWKVRDLKDMERMIRGHYTTNFVSFSKRKGIMIDPSIYDFIEGVDLNNARLGFHVNNRNFQYFYFKGKVPAETPDSLYPFAVIDTIKQAVTLPSMRERLISNTVYSGLSDKTVNHDKLVEIYKNNVADIPEDDSVLEKYRQVQQLKIGSQAPSLGGLENLGGELVDMNDFKGRNILLNVWGTWCPYCKQELPHLKKLIEKYPNHFTSVAVSLDTDQKKWKDYVAENVWSGIHLINPDMESEFTKNYLATSTNIYYLIDKEGKIVMDNYLKPSDMELEHKIKALK